MDYKAADKAIKTINRENLKLFGQLKARLMKADELHVIREVSGTYDRSLRIVEKQYLALAVEAYRKTMADCGKRKRCPLDRDWLFEFLMIADPVTLYRFLPEWERKKARTTEAIAASTARSKVIDDALKALARQIGQGAIDVTDAATIAAYMDAGVKKVMWVSERDERVCSTCEDMDGNVYDIDSVPPKPHRNCRCVLRPIL